MNPRKTLFLIVLVALGAGLVVWDHYKGTTTSDRELQNKRILNLDTQQVSYFELVRSNQTIGLQKTGDNWEIKQPLGSDIPTNLTLRADSSAVSSTLAELEFAERSRTLTEKDLRGVSLAGFGLEPPRASLRLRAKSGWVTLLIGGETPTKNALYVQVAGRREVCVAPLSLFERATQSLNGLRSRTAIEFAPAAVTRLEIKTADRILELKKTDAHWTLVRPLAARADQQKISELLSGLAGLQVLDFVSEDPKDLHSFHLDEPDHEVTVYTGEVGQGLLLGRSLTNDAGKVYAKLKSADSIFTLAAEPAKKFAVQINDLRDLRVLAFEPAAVKSLAIERGADKLGLQRDAQGWRLTAPVNVAAEESAVNHLLAELAGVQAKRFVADVTAEPQQYGLVQPAATVTLTGPGTNALAQLLIGSVDASNALCYVKCAGAEFIYGIATNWLDQLPATAGALRSRSIFDLKPEQITKLMAGPVTVVREQGQWKLGVPAQGVLDVDAVNAIVALFAQLRAESFGSLPAAPDDGRGYTLQATIGTTTHWLTVAANGSATASTVEVPFQLPAAAVVTLTKPLLTAKP